MGVGARINLAVREQTQGSFRCCGLLLPDVATDRKRSAASSFCLIEILVLLIERIFGQRLTGQHCQRIAVLAKTDDLFVERNPTWPVKPRG